MKVNTTLTIDIGIRQKAKQLNINLSELFKEALINKIAIIEEDIDGIDFLLLKRELEREEKKLTNQGQKVSNLRTKLIMIEEKKQKLIVQALEEKKKEIEEGKKCKNCGLVIPEGITVHEFKIGKICNSCFMKSDKTDYKKWSCV
jgi:hypothetical protein